MSTWLNTIHPIGLVNRGVGITGWFTIITFLFTASSANVSRNQYCYFLKCPNENKTFSIAHAQYNTHTRPPAKETL